MTGPSAIDIFDSDVVAEVTKEIENIRKEIRDGATKYYKDEEEKDRKRKAVPSTLP